MSFEDFMNNMDHVLMCHLTVESFSSEILDVRAYNYGYLFYKQLFDASFNYFKNFSHHSYWKSIMYEGDWNSQRGTSGGCGNINPGLF